VKKKCFSAFYLHPKHHKDLDNEEFKKYNFFSLFLIYPFVLPLRSK